MSTLGQAFAGQRIFLTGATGFLGKVYLAKLLNVAPQVASVKVLIRPRQNKDAQQRLDAELLSHEALAGISSDLKARVEVVAGGDLPVAQVVPLAVVATGRDGETKLRHTPRGRRHRATHGRRIAQGKEAVAIGRPRSQALGVDLDRPVPRRPRLSPPRSF